MAPVTALDVFGAVGVESSRAERWLIYQICQIGLVWNATLRTVERGDIDRYQKMNSLLITGKNWSC